MLFTKGIVFVELVVVDELRNETKIHAFFLFTLATYGGGVVFRIILRFFMRRRSTLVN